MAAPVADVRTPFHLLSCYRTVSYTHLDVYKRQDLLYISRRKVAGVVNYKLDTLASFFLLSERTAHRALEDCKLAHAIYQKLNEKE